MHSTYENLDAKTLRDVRSVISKEAYRRSPAKIWFWCCFDVLFFFAALFGVILIQNPFLKILMSIITGLAVSSLFVLAHDAAHGALFRRSWFAELVGTIFMLPALNVYRLWCLGHNRIHHGFTSLSSVDWIWRPLTLEEYDALPKYKKALYRIERSLYGCGLHYLYKVWLPKMILFTPANLTKSEKAKLWLGKLVVAFYATGMSIFAYHLDGIFGIVTMLIIPFIVFNYVISLIVYLHHTHPDIPFFDAKPEWNHTIGALYCTTMIHSHWLINILTHDIMVHTPHHVDIRIPFYRLKGAFENIKQHYADYLHEYTLTWSKLTSIFKSCKIYDYQKHEWHGFKKSKKASHQ
jgi:omega-6 fatty acid desaturase (delta-12 desaturase)